ncbi:MAG: phosphatidylserine/phosphatidylglycerophosphate/cardiolipin synthase family protein [Bdellovibrionales bacterium]|nr:phosphatidylserine/phosphatidylglycerophosphate/cardiolipin synthase family protein [Bdellovibrionales bacterium]NQZ17773.1 phosphatidylserine/phosphatidylglycerophosphate/cardiolipin synthase family protein [Bdellovibrionales bacterium]
MKKTILLLSMFIFNSVWANDFSVILSQGERNQSLRSDLVSNNFQNSLDELSNSVRVKGNRALMLMNGKMSYPARYAMIKNAKKSIILSTFSIYSRRTSSGDIADESSREMVRILLEKKRAGLEVIVIYDGATSVLAQSQTAIDRLREGGVKVIKYNPVVSQNSELPLGLSLLPGAIRFATNQNPINNRWHEKTLIVDGKYLLTGGLNWGDLYATGNTYSSYSYRPQDFFSQPLIREIGVPPQSSWGPLDPDSWRDTDLLVEGPVVTQAVRRLLFDFSLLDLLGQSGRPGFKYKNASMEDILEAYNQYMVTYGQHESKYFDTNYLNTERQTQVFSGSFQPTMRYIYQRPYMDRRLDERNQQLAQHARSHGLEYNADNPSTYITNYYLNVINKAQKQILWGCHSNRPTDQMLDALKRAALRGVKIYIMGNSREAAKTLPDGGQIMYPSALCHYRPLIQAGQGNIRIFEWQREESIAGQNVKSGAFHSKVFSVDGVITSVGSYNMSKASFRKHTEGTIVVADPQFSRVAEQMFEEDLKFTREVTLDNLPASADTRCSNY